MTRLRPGDMVNLERLSLLRDPTDHHALLNRPVKPDDLCLVLSGPVNFSSRDDLYLLLTPVGLAMCSMNAIEHTNIHTVGDGVSSVDIV